MENFNANIQLRVMDSVYIKNPESSELGLKIISGSIELLDILGFENFTFKKLAILINSTEASIYRYFESKHQLLSYLACWYWGWTEYRILFGIANVESPSEKLKKALQILTEPVQIDDSFSHINEVKLNKILIREFSKIYLNTHVDEDNKVGYFLPFKSVVARVSNIVTEINPDFKFPHMLISTIIEGAHHQRFFAEHLPRLTDTLDGQDAVTMFYTDMVFRTISKD
jgi:AcrR family transcriptional regulator